MKVFIVGNGKLASELLNLLELDTLKPSDKIAVSCPSIVIHAGSGRELDEVIAYCQNTDSVLVELSTGSIIENIAIDFTAVLCPNVNILMLKFMNMISNSGNMFKEHNIQLTESHHSEKTSVPGTAVYLADSLGVSISEVNSIRSPDDQKKLLGIPSEHLSRHALHQVSIRDSSCSISLESRVYGEAPYASGVLKIINAVKSTQLETRLYTINEFIENGWI